MREEGFISRIISDQSAEVEFVASSACKSCGKCSLGKQGQPVVETINNVGAKVGDRVEVEFSSSKLLGTSFLLYIVPLLGLIFGYYLGEALGKGELAGILVGVIGFFAVVFFMKSLDTKLGKSVSCEIVRIL